MKRLVVIGLLLSAFSGSSQYRNCFTEQVMSVTSPISGSDMSKGTDNVSPPGVFGGGGLSGYYSSSHHHHPHHHHHHGR